MRVLAMFHAYLRDYAAGAEMTAHELLKPLAARGHEVHVILSRGPAGDPYEIDGVHVHPYVDKHDPFRWFERGVDVVVTHLENTIRASLLCQWNGIPHVQILHNDLPMTRHWVHHGNPDLVVYNSHWLKESIGWDGPGIVVPPPVWVADYATTPGDRVTLVNLRQMEGDGFGATMGKGAELFWALAERMPKVRFLGVRGGYGTQMVRDLPNVEVLDHVPHDHMRDKVYARTRILLMPSSYESWGRVGVEAMCSGIPVIAHPTPGLVEALGDAGIFVDRDDIDGWEREIRRLRTPAAWRKASAAALARAAELDPTADLDRWCDAVESVARNGYGYQTARRVA